MYVENQYSFAKSVMHCKHRISLKWPHSYHTYWTYLTEKQIYCGMCSDMCYTLRKIANYFGWFPSATENVCVLYTYP